MRLLALCALSLVFCACSSPATPAAADAVADAQTPPAHEFPKGFLWGTAIAGFQVDMGCPSLPAVECEDRQSDWYQWVSDKDLIADKTNFISGEPVSMGPGFWEMWPAHMDNAANDLHNNAIRYSLEWSRLFPDAAAGKAKTVSDLKALANPAAVKKYHEIFAGAKARNLKLLITLNHYTLPLWLHNGKECNADLDACPNKGWADKNRILPAIALYSGYCAEEFGGEVDLWGTINEPFAVVVAGYLLPTKDRTNPPGQAFKVDVAIQVAFNMMEAHAKMYDAVHEHDKIDADDDGIAARVGIVSNLAAVKPFDPSSEKDKIAAQHAQYVYNQAFLDATIKGDLDRNLDGTAEEHREDMKGRMDFIGINYYTKLPVKSAIPIGGDSYKYLDFLPDSNLFANYPDGIYEVVKWASQYNLPMIITENGTGDPKSMGYESFVKPHLVALHKAIAEGAKVEGYFYWSLMDNYEWNHGVTPIKMGMFSVDATTKKLNASALSAAYGKLAQDNGF